MTVESIGFGPLKGPDWASPDRKPPGAGMQPGFRDGAGYWSTIGGDIHDPAVAPGENSLALGDGAHAGASESDSNVAALGPYAYAVGDGALAVGGTANADGFHATAVGPGSSATAESAAAFGPGASASGVRSWAVGADAGSAVDDTGALKADHVVIQPSVGPSSDLTLYDTAGAAHVLAVTDTGVTFDGTPIGGGGAGGTWHEDEVDVGTGSTSVAFSLVPDPATISIQVWVNGLLLRRDVDWDYANPDPGDATVTVPGVVEGDYVVLRWQEA